MLTRDWWTRVSAVCSRHVLVRIFWKSHVRVCVRDLEVVHVHVRVRVRDSQKMSLVLFHVQIGWFTVGFEITWFVCPKVFDFDPIQLESGTVLEIVNGPDESIWTVLSQSVRTTTIWKNIHDYRFPSVTKIFQLKTSRWDWLTLSTSRPGIDESSLKWTAQSGRFSKKWTV